MDLPFLVRFELFESFFLWASRNSTCSLIRHPQIFEKVDFFDPTVVVKNLDPRTLPPSSLHPHTHTHPPQKNPCVWVCGVMVVKKSFSLSFWNVLSELLLNFVVFLISRSLRSAKILHLEVCFSLPCFFLNFFRMVGNSWRKS